ncbi:MAG: hypothetical protein JEZ11_13150 [Desulfobacterales bacterium]|nr:hypothetical protein [Desulfobacterales bacterium]
MTVGDTNHPAWKRAFITDDRREGCSIGRVSFKDGEHTDFKSYKKNYQTEVDDTDLIFMRLMRYLSDGVVVPKSVFRRFVTEANRIRKVDLDEKLAWRKANPARTRHGKPIQRGRLVGKNVRYILGELIMNWEVSADV